MIRVKAVIIKPVKILVHSEIASETALTFSWGNHAFIVSMSFTFARSKMAK